MKTIAMLMLFLWTTVAARGQFARGFDPNANSGGSNGSESVTESLRNAFIAGAATPTASPCGATFTENFDGVTPPALPPGWTATNVLGPPPLWSTSAGNPDTAQNAFIGDTSIISDKVLDRAGVAINSAAPVISFRNNFDTEFSEGTYWDGGVLEISSPNINGGAFTDVTDPAVGGTFVSGPYTGTISPDASNPLADRMAWSGSSGGYIDTVINMGPNLNGQTITLRWRMGTDEAVGAVGWRIDTIVLVGVACPTPTPGVTATPATPSPSPTPLSTPTPSGTPTPTPLPQLINLSTRMRVETGDRVGIGGFIITGTSSKTVLLRAIGPSLVGFGVPVAEVLADPVMELHGPGAFATITNNNWRDTQEAAIQATGIPPTNDLESAILVTLAPGNYAAIVRGNGATAVARSGVALVEVYDLDPAADSPSGAGIPKLGNISTRAFCGLGSNIVIAGFILGNANGDDNVIIRGLGPSLGAVLGAANVMANPTLELRDSNGTLLSANNDWQDNPAQAAIIAAAGLAPSNSLESAIAATLPPGIYTALLAGLNNGTGIGLVEIYDREIGDGGPPPSPTPGGTPTPTTTPGGTPTPTPTPPGGTPTPTPTATPGGTPMPTPTPTPPTITSPLVASGTVNLPFLYQFTATGATSLGVTNLSPGLTFNTNLAAIAGIPTAAGTFQVGLSATNSGGTTNATLTITVQPFPLSGPVIVSSTCATARTGRAFSFQLQQVGGSSATHFAADSVLPPGVSLDPSTGFISGVSTSDGSFNLAVSAIDGAAVAHGTLQLTFTSNLNVPIITSDNSAILTPGQFFSYTITADANGTFGYIGTDGIVHQGPSSAGLPPGLSFDGINTISGTFNPPPFNHDGGPRKIPNLSGGIVTNVQLFAVDPSGLGTFPWIYFLDSRGTVQISTRLMVGTGDNVLIGGFNIVGTGTTRVIVRAIGPSLTASGVPDVLANPVLELREGGTGLGFNDNWEDSQKYPIADTHFQPTNPLESAILAFLSPGSYTAIVSGINNTTGNALVEVFDLGIAALLPVGNARLANISARGIAGTGDNVIIGGFCVGPLHTSTRVIIRAIGPSLAGSGVPNPLSDPTLDLRDAHGTILISNNDWQEGTPADIQEIQNLGLAPTNFLESAIIKTLPDGNYTAIVSPRTNTPTGVALVEVYSLDSLE
jgi:hypothetical protein